MSFGKSAFGSSVPRDIVFQNLVDVDPGRNRRSTLTPVKRSSKQNSFLSPQGHQDGYLMSSIKSHFSSPQRQKLRMSVSSPRYRRGLSRSLCTSPSNRGISGGTTTWIKTPTKSASLSSLALSPGGRKSSVTKFYPKLRRATAGPGDYLGPLDTWSVKTTPSNSFTTVPRGTEKRWKVHKDFERRHSSDLETEQLRLHRFKLNNKEFKNDSRGRYLDWYAEMRKAGVAVPDSNHIASNVQQPHNVFHQWKFTKESVDLVTPGPGEYGAFLPSNQGKHTDIWGKPSFNSRWGYRSPLQKKLEKEAERNLREIQGLECEG